MNLGAILIYAYGTSESVRKSWDTRGRGRKKIPPADKTTTPSSEKKSLRDVLTSVAVDYKARQTANQIADVIEKGGGIDQRLIDRIPIKKIYTNETLMRKVGANAAYDSHAQKMIVGEPEKSSTAPELIATHEYGHHLYNNWLATDWERNFGGTPAMPAMADWDAAKAKEDVLNMHDEYDKAMQPINDKMKEAGSPSENFLGADPEHYMNGRSLMHIMPWSVIENLNLKIPAIRAVGNVNEWFAEGFRDYMESSTTKDRLKNVCPETYNLIDTLVKGGYFKNAAN